MSIKDFHDIVVVIFYGFNEIAKGRSDIRHQRVAEGRTQAANIMSLQKYSLEYFRAFIRFGVSFAYDFNEAIYLALGRSIYFSACC